MTTAVKICVITLCMGLWLIGQGDCRYLPTRSHGDELDKLRELMLQILESSNEEHPANDISVVDRTQQQQQPSLRSTWLNKLNSLDSANGDTFNGKLLAPSNYRQRNSFDISRYY